MRVRFCALKANAAYFSGASVFQTSSSDEASHFKDHEWSRRGLFALVLPAVVNGHARQNSVSECLVGGFLKMDPVSIPIVAGAVILSTLGVVAPAMLLNGQHPLFPFSSVGRFENSTLFGARCQCLTLRIRAGNFQPAPTRE